MSIEFFLEKEKAQIALLSSQLDEFKEMLKNSKAELSLLLAGMAPPPVGTAADVAKEKGQVFTFVFNAAKNRRQTTIKNQSDPFPRLTLHVAVKRRF